MKRSTYLAIGLVLLSTAAWAGAPATTFQVTKLISNQAGVAANTDPDLVNAWGVAQLGTGPLWVADNGSGVSTVYDHRTGEKLPLTVTIPGGAPTGMVAIPDDGDGIVDFPITKNGVTGQSVFIFVTENGRIEGWNPNVDAQNAVVAVDRSDHGVVFKGVGLSDGKDLLYAADFQHGRVDAFDSHFNIVNAFTDPELPMRYKPFNVRVLGGLVYVAFAKREKGGIDNVNGPGFGYVDVFLRDGHLKTRLIANGVLNAPWGMAIAPPNFGTFAGDLLVGNFGDGKINAFDRNTGNFVGTLTDAGGSPIVIDGLWALENKPSNSVTFSAGPDDEANGLVGLITPVAAVAKN
jgi:uncharacterized protein (TIGR03118 family)